MSRRFLRLLFIVLTCYTLLLALNDFSESSLKADGLTLMLVAYGVACGLGLRWWQRRTGVGSRVNIRSEPARRTSFMLQFIAFQALALVGVAGFMSLLTFATPILHGPDAESWKWGLGIAAIVLPTLSVATDVILVVWARRLARKQQLRPEDCDAAGTSQV